MPDEGAMLFPVKIPPEAVSKTIAGVMNISFIQLHQETVSITETYLEPSQASTMEL